MKPNHALLAVIVAACAWANSGHTAKADDAKSGKETAAVKREAIEWCDVWVMGANQANLPRVLVIGDSIAKSYYPAVEKAFKGQAQCARLATSKSICDPAFLRELGLVLDDYTFSVIHINNGLHGWDYSEDDYAKALPAVLDFFRAHAKEAKIVWANTTPVRKGKAVSEVDPKTTRVQERNRIAGKIAETRALPVTDLYAVVAEHPEYFSEDGVHFNADGQRALAEKVIAAISTALKR